MNEISYDAPRPEAVRDLGDMLATQHLAAPAQTEELARTFLARVQRDIDEQVDLRVKQQLATWKAPRGVSNQDKELILGTLGIAIPLSGVAGFFGGIWGIVIVWVCLVLINLAWSQRH